MLLRPLALLVSLLAAVLAVRAEEPAPVSTAAPKPPSVTVVPVVSRDLVARVTVTGTLVPRETVVVGTDIEGLRIEALLADEGDRVEAGAVLAKLSTDTIEIELARNQSQISRTEAAIAQARSQIEEAQSASIEAEAALARTQPLQQKGIVGQDVLDQRVSAAASARARLASARQAATAAEADRAIALAERREQELRRAKTDIKAPTAGLVLSRAARLGSVVSVASGGLFEMARDGLIELDAEVSETVLNTLRQGQRVTVTLSGGGEAVAGEIRLVSPKVDETTRLGRVRIALPPSDALRTGAFARGSVETARSTGLAVPQTAVVVDERGARVQVVRDGKVETRAVATGIQSGGEIEIVKGLSGGEDIVSRAGTFVRDGDLVTPVEEAAGAAEVRT
ncbi:MULTISPECIES: efflux RND transporter periplasmic adaptor subunit [unclassified Aureimonas]|uniref:efflux RND transporter periplasmic adaptor subunit n=1 Tax=unclassified Aureimonas TaxID=2615206 RepID=UPI0009E8B358|nr:MULTISPECIES: efflux RND transporter periplasmic adaptor subunit [unclassified Aureimonas]